MFSTERRRLFYGGDQGFGRTSYDYRNCTTGEIAFSTGSDIIVSSTILMAEEESSRNDQNLQEGEKSNSKDHEGDDQDWLQLGIGGRTTQDVTTSRKSGTKLVELELMPSSSSNINYNNNGGDHLQMRPLTTMQELGAPRSVMINNYAAFNPSFFSQQFYPRNSSSWSNLFPPQHQQAANWGFGPQVPINIATSSSFTNPSNSLASPSNYLPRLYPPFEIMSQRSSSIDFRVIQPPRRPYSGIWFMLQALQNQAKEPFLPQLPKRYLRIKDSKMTIQLVIKYLVNKLKLANESEIEIICKGHRLQPFVTLQHVRDNIWSSSRDFITLLPNSSTTDHIMVLCYGRTADTSI